MQQLVSRSVGVCPLQKQLAGQLLQRGGSVLRPYVVGDLPHQHGAVPEVLAQKAVARQHVQLLQHRAVLLSGQRHGGGGHQLLGHGRHGVRLQRIEADTLVGGVLVDEPHVLLPVLADNIGFQHLSGDAPRRLADGFLLRHGQLLLDVLRCHGGRVYLRISARLRGSAHALRLRSGRAGAHLGAFRPVG